MRKFWQKLPEQIKRLFFFTIVIAVLFLIARSLLIPEDFGVHGHYRASAVDEIAAHELRFAGHKICNDCHDDITGSKNLGYHRNLACEICHGPSASHTEDPESYIPPAPRERGYCPICHEYNPSRPTGFPQIITTSHNPGDPCIDCHDPHAPEPPETPKECSACHAEIARSKSLSHHIDVPCTFCHVTPEMHKVSPHEILASKPKTRELCGKCHSLEVTGEMKIPKVNMNTHESRYVCWQCHYPHLPEAR